MGVVCCTEDVDYNPENTVKEKSAVKIKEKSLK
jgi:hypothetical protein